MDKKTNKSKKKKGEKASKSAKTNFFDSFLIEVAKKIRKKWDGEENLKLEGKNFPEGVTCVKDVSYAGDKKQSHTLDIYFKEQSKLKAILIDIHGGAFVSGSKESDRLFAGTMASLGYLVFSLNYGLAPGSADVFGQIRDVHLATGWIVKNAKTYGGDLKNVYFSGHSAGAVLSVAEILLNIDSKMREAYKLEKLDYDVKGAILNCGFMRFYQNILPYQLTRRVVFPPKFEKDERYKFLLFNKNDKLKELPKIFLVTNSKDEIKSMTFYFDKLLTSIGLRHKLSKESEGGHVGLIYDPLSEKNRKVIEEINRFFGEQ